LWPSLRAFTSTGLVAQPMLNITSQSAGFEAGLTGMALDPGFAPSGNIFIDFRSNLSDGLHCRVARGTVTGNTGALGAILFDYKAQGPTPPAVALKLALTICSISAPATMTHPPRTSPR
jgi:hypothetical protein